MSSTAHRAKSIRIRTPLSTILFNAVGGTVLFILAVLCVLPFILLVSASFTSENSIVWDGYRFIPGEFSTRAYEILLRSPQVILNAYGVSIFITVVGTAAGLLITAFAAYALSRPYFRYRSQFAFFFYFTTLFNGGMLSSYIFFVRYYNLKNTYFALILPTLIHVFFLLIMRTFMATIPESICESAKIDGAGHFTIFTRIVLPVLTPGLATVGLFLALGYWNDWWLALNFIDNEKLYPLQFLLRKILSNISFAASGMSTTFNIATIPQETVKMATCVVTIGPVILIYPFVQRYFIKGITVGAVKG